ncbi:chemotaxis protein CheA [Ornithinibacillus massiliensis]|uniref:Chemotaxis protein CheA n=1 Tax=Ornithinibacillus massiliensis TaxID=1944633 RepID=A0ABS5MCI4_9BACI|nr:chemotaxis protein CheA [Ornithinibacillus massiliensis]MBS3680029.1 chemotaxis protein CheA [Ornithinibacillus massiliensis]
MDTTQYLDVFIDESNEHIEVLYKKLLELEKDPNEKAIIEEIFRAAHTLKGMSATMGYNDLATLTHTLENAFDAIRYDRVQVQSDMIDLLVDTVDHLNTMVEDIASGGTGSLNVKEIASKLEMIEKGTPISEPNKEIKLEVESPTISNVFTNLDAFELSILNESKERGFQNYEITVQLREDCLLKGARVFMVFEVLEQLGEVIKSEPSVNDLEEENFDDTFSVILVSNQDTEEIAKKIKKVSEIEEVSISDFSVSNYRETNESEVLPAPTEEENTSVTENKVEKKDKEQETKKASHNNKTIRVNIDKLDVLMNLFEELIIDRGRLEQISVDLQNADLKETVERMARISSDLQNIILTMRMVPIDTVFSRFPRMVRKLARDLNKQIDIEIIGADTELDRTVIDEIGDPIVHLLRNAIDHGVESPEERIRKGKPEKGTIELKAYHSGNHVFIEISDDGAGINKDKVLQKAINNGILTESAAEGLSEQQIYELILESGFSTADKISDISGRGVGLDVVKNTIESLGGRISIDSEYNKGSVFSIQLPLTLTIISALLVELNKEKYAIPLSSIIETAIISKEQILSAHHKKVIDFRGKVVPLIDLKGIFGVEQEAAPDEYTSIVFVKKGEKIAALVVDSFIGQQEIVLKSLGSLLSNTFAISGATILGDGEVALIIDSNAIIK